MKLFDAIFEILIEQGKTLTLGGDLDIHALKLEEETTYYLNFDYNSDRSWASEQHNPNREQIEEYLAKIILEKEKLAIEITDFIKINLKNTENPLSNGEPIQKILKNDHPKIVKKVETYTTSKELKNAAADLIIEVIKEKGNGPKFNRTLGRGDKETYEEFWFEKEDGKFHYQEGDTQAYGHPDIEKTFESDKELKTELLEHWIDMKDGWLTGKGNPIMFMPNYLKDRDLGTIRDYIESKDNKKK